MLQLLLTLSFVWIAPALGAFFGRNAVAGQQAIFRAGAFDSAAAAELQQVFCQGTPLVLTGSADLISYPGLVFLNGSGVDATTLVAPAAGAQGGGGDDGKTIVIVDAGGHAHTITTPSNAIVPSHHVLTFNATAGSWVRLVAWNGNWYVLGSTGVTAS